MIGRQEERRRIMSAYNSDESEFVTVYGRRRIGKTYFVNEVFNGRFAFHHSGVRRGDMKEQLTQFRYSLKLQGHRDCPALKNWLGAFFELERFLESLPEGRKVVFLDELPWMDTRKSGFLAALEAFWNGWAFLRKDIMLVTCGSATSWIVKNILRNKGGLHNRVRVRIKMFPFTLRECELYANERGLGFDRFAIAECYMALGGVAYYWSLLEKGKSPAQNFDALFFGRQDGLRLEFDELYSSLFANSVPYMKIVLAIGGRNAGLTREEVSGKTGIESGGDLTRYLDDLEECGFIRKYRPMGSGNKATFQLVDNFTLFYLDFLKGGAPRTGDCWSEMFSDSRKNTWRGLAFERICLEHVSQIKAALGISGVYADVYSWKERGEGNERGAQVDLLISRRDGIVNLCEMKWSREEYSIDKDEHERLVHRIEAFRKCAGRNKSIHLTMVTTFGIKRNMYANDVQSEVTLDDLFRE